MSLPNRIVRENVLMRKRAVRGPLPADEAGARKAGDAFLKKLLNYAGNLEARPRALVGAVFQYTRFVNARPPADSGGSWRLLYRPYLRGRRKEQGWLIDDRQAYIALEIGGNGLAISFEVHLRPVVQPKEVKPLPVTSTEGLLRLPDSEALLVTYRVDLEGGYYAPYYVRAVQSREEWQRVQKGDVNGLLVPAAGESKIEIKEEKAEGCFCNRDFTTEELKRIIVSLRKSFKLNEKGNATIYDWIKDSIFMKNIDEFVKNNSISYFTKSLNEALSKYGIDRCITKIHFIAQSYHESQSFTKTYEDKPRPTVKGGPFYRGRGLIQLTHDEGYKLYFEDLLKEELNIESLNKLVPLVAKDLKYSCESSAWFWAKSGINFYALKDDAVKVSAAINFPLALKKPEKVKSIYGLEERKKITEILKITMRYENCRNK